MKFAVMSANGRTGAEFVAAALASGHTVQAGVYGQPELTIAHPNLKIVRCDGTNIENVRALLTGQDAVISFLGHVKGSPKNVQTDTMNNILTVMKEQSIKRLVTLTGTGVRFAEDKISFIDRLLNIGISIIDPARVHDGIHHVDLIKTSDTDWTVLRVLKLQKTNPQPYHLSAHGPARLITGRSTVAKAALEVLENHSFIRQAPIIGH